MHDETDNYVTVKGYWMKNYIDPVDIKKVKHITEFRRYGEGAGAHNGYDAYADIGTPIRAAADGTVIEVDRSSGLGIYVAIYHGKDEDGKDIATVYGHCNSKNASPQMTVKQGDKIGEVWKTGGVKNSHLHFEVRENGKMVDPQKYVYKHVKVTNKNTWWSTRKICKDDEHAYVPETTDRYHYLRCTNCGDTTELVENA
jgi:murein DD-endopeptidase MepM/ murein hydrolase activator NlpD